MRRGALAAVLLFTAGCASMSARSPLAESRQLIVVTSPSWDAIDATLQRYARSSPSQPWIAVGDRVPVVLGRTGLAWGRGVAEVPSSSPQKHEGDGKSPAGIFTLGTAFGFALSIDSRLGYVMLRDTTECVDDGASEHYNAIVERDRVARVDWSSSEKMRAVEQYRNGIVVNHNVPPQRGGGSCIFLHIWSASSKPTSGCTAMAENDLRSILEWLDPAARPVMVQLPSEEYVRFRREWNLPD